MIRGTQADGPRPLRWLLRQGPAVAASCAMLAMACDGAHEDPAPANPEVLEDPAGGWVTGLPGSYSVRSPHGELAKRLAESPTAGGTAAAGSPAGGMTNDGLGQIGYAQGTEAARSTSGVITKDPERVLPAPTLLIHGNAAAAELIDIDGQLLHRWQLPYERLPEAPPLEGDHQIPWRAVELLPDGGLLAIHSGRALIRIDKDSNLVWCTFGRFHHDVVREDPGTILALSRRQRLVPKVHPTDPVVDDLLVKLDLDSGEVLHEQSLWDALIHSPYVELLGRLNVREGDVMHANGLWPVTERDAEAAGVRGIEPGSVLVSMRDLDLVACVAGSKVEWLTHGPRSSPWRGLHDPVMTPRGHLLVFDNLGGPGSTSRLLEVRPADASIAWTYNGVPPESFHSLFCGTVQVLGNGHVLAAESCNGRVIEIDPQDRAIVWEYVSPHVTGPGNKYVAAVFSATRVESPLPWLPN